MHTTDNRYISLLRWLGYLTVFATIVSLYDKLWLFELFTHFTVQYLVILSLLAIVFLYRRSKLFLLFFIFITVNLYKFHDLTTVQISNATQVSQTIKVATLNLEMSNTQYSRARTFIHEYSADILLLTELTPKWLAQLGSLQSMYPYSYRLPQKDGFGLALYSRFPILNSKTVMLDEPVNPTIVSELDINGTKITVYGVHLFSPTTNHYFHSRNRQLEKLAVLLKERISPTMVVGDMNITSWSSHYTKFINKTSLRNSTDGKGFQPTWPSYLFPFYIQLDHILLSKEFFVVNSKSEKSVGSDHFPLVAEISLAGT